MNEQRNTVKNGLPAWLLGAICFVLAPLSALFLAEAHSFIALFDALSTEARASFPIISICFFVGFLLFQAVLTGLCAEILYKKPKLGVVCVLAGFVGTVCGILASPVFYGKIEAAPFMLVCSFVLAGAFMASSYKKGEDKKTSILMGCGGGAIVFFITLLLSALFYEKGFAVYFEGFFERIRQGIERFSTDTVAVLVDYYGSEQALFEKLTVGVKVDPSVTAQAYIANYRQTYAGALTFLVYLAPGILFDLFTVPCYLAYGVLRLNRMLAGDKEKRLLSASPVAAVTLAVCLIFYAFFSMFLGGGFVTVLALNLIVMLTPLLFVPGLKVTVEMMKQLFKNNKLMFVICGVIILFSPFMVVALSGCYAIFGQMLKRFFEKRGMGS